MQQQQGAQVVGRRAPGHMPAAGQNAGLAMMQQQWGAGWDGSMEAGMGLGGKGPWRVAMQAISIGAGDVNLLGVLIRKLGAFSRNPACYLISRVS